MNRFLPQVLFGCLSVQVYLTIRSFNFFNIHHHSLKPKAFPNQDRERGGREETEGGSGAQKKKKKNVVIHNLTKHWCSKSTAEEKKMRDTYKHRNKQSARLAVLTANNKINKTCREKVNGCQDRQEDVPYHTTAREANTLKEWHAWIPSRFFTGRSPVFKSSVRLLRS